MLDQLITTGIGLGLLAGGYLLWLLTGVINCVVNTRRWSWKKTITDISKAFLMGVVILGLVALANGLDWYTKLLGFDISTFTDGMSTLTMLGGIIAGIAVYYGRAMKNALNFFKLPSDVTPVGEQNYAGVAEPVKQAVDLLFFSGVNAEQEDTSVKSGAVMAKAGQKAAAELGAYPYYKVDVSTPTAFHDAVLGKGFDEGFNLQCVALFKEFMFSLSGKYVAAGGAAANYAWSPARENVCKLGFTWHDGAEGLQDGDWGIWTNGAYGHVAMYYQGKWLGQNQGAEYGDIGNVANLLGLSLTGLAGYFRPNIYKAEKPAPAPTPPAPQPAPNPDNVVHYTYKAGDTFGQVITDLGLKTSHGLWGDDGDVAYYNQQLHEKGIWGNIPIGATINLVRRPE